MSKTDNIYLIGPMGSGKTSVGKALATQGALQFYDSDEVIEQRTGVSVSWIFAVEQETGFRKREQAAIAELTQLTGIVLATGGGCVLNEDNRKQLSENGTVVYLQASLNEQLRRTSRRKGVRPLLAEKDPKLKLQQLNIERDPLYRQTADLIYNTDHLKPREIAEKIFFDISKLKK